MMNIRESAITTMETRGVLDADMLRLGLNDLAELWWLATRR
ncbi:hypothetical protein [Rhizobium esperanzae]|uniref:Uncharacterized protein n=1 Tax=Rhizobium esperanzae TaxID=1967781 RepID=A0A7W6W7Q3_9HYPH|nr:hypothetical protein [Rhizobium esperanzae]MBB4238541.1 hypothetical protein [Rhizobium esperanzae]